MISAFLTTSAPTGKFKRCYGQGYTFVYPTEWVADTFVALAKVQRQTKSLDYRITRSGASVTVPDEGAYSYHPGSFHSSNRILLTLYMR